MEVILASANPHKAEELEKLLVPQLNIKAAVKKIDVNETGQSFSENALLKAEAYFNEFQKPSLSDDSGLVLEDFPLLLGVQSARFMPEIDDYKSKCEEILKLYQNDQELKRRAYFVSVICLYLSPEEYFLFEGRCHGCISKKLKGNEGFGYDPIFIPDGNEDESFASDPAWKEIHGHRAKAISSLKAFTSNHLTDKI